MTKQEFLYGLRTALEGEVPLAVIHENLRYYQDYISTEVQYGRTEADVTQELGDPRLIAKTIIDTTPGGGENWNDSQGQAGGGYSYSGTSEQEAYSGTSRRESEAGASQRTSYAGAGGNQTHYYNLNKWYVKLAVILVLILIVCVLLTVLGGLLSLLMPLLPVIFIIYFVMWLFRGPRR